MHATRPPTPALPAGVEQGIRPDGALAFTGRRPETALDDIRSSPRAAGIRIRDVAERTRLEEVFLDLTRSTQATAA